MFDIAWSELLVIGAVALVVIGPKDLPKALRTVGMMVNKARGLAREFQSGLDDMIRESELEELRKAAKVDLKAEANKIFDPTGEVAKTGEELAKAVDVPPADLVPAEPPPAEPVAPVELPAPGEAYIPPPAVEEPKLAEPVSAEPVKPAGAA
jgi:sec-independent protein translocase protein TatB